MDIFGGFFVYYIGRGNNIGKVFGWGIEVRFMWEEESKMGERGKS